VGGASPGHISCTSSFFGARRIGVVVAAVRVTGRRATLGEITRGADAVVAFVLIGVCRTRWIGGTMIAARLVEVLGGSAKTRVAVVAGAIGVTVVGARSEADMPGTSLATGAGLGALAGEPIGGGGVVSTINVGVPGPSVA
jgi:hypothetical protein